MKKLLVLIGALLLAPSLGWAQNITVKVNGSTKTGSSLENALSGETLGNITSLEVTAGSFTAADWTYIRGGGLLDLERFVVGPAVSVYQETTSSASNSLFLQGNSKLKYISVANLVTIPDYLCSMNTSLEEVVFPDATTVGVGAFSSVSTTAPLHTARLPKVTAINANAFQRCNQLVLMEIGANPPSVASSAFAEFSKEKYRELLFVDNYRQPLDGLALVGAQEGYELSPNGGESNGYVTWCLYWSIYTSFRIIYDVDGPGTLTIVGGKSDFYVSKGHDGPKVTAVADGGGYEFLRWSDGSTKTTHRVEDVQNNMTITAYFGVPVVKKLWL